MLYGTCEKALKRNYFRLKITIFACPPSWRPELQQLCCIAKVTLRMKTTQRGSEEKGKEEPQSVMILELQHTPWTNYILISITWERSKHPSNLTHSVVSKANLQKDLGLGWVNKGNREQGECVHLYSTGMMFKIRINQNGCWLRDWKMLLCLVLFFVAKLCGDPIKGPWNYREHRSSTSNKVFNILRWSFWWMSSVYHFRACGWWRVKELEEIQWFHRSRSGWIW